jgi:hypothetical protein
MQEVRRQRTHIPGAGSMSWIWLNIPFAVVIVAFTVGLPLWVIVKHPEGEALVDSPAQVSPHKHTSFSPPDGEVSAKGAPDRARHAA